MNYPYLVGALLLAMPFGPALAEPFAARVEIPGEMLKEAHSAHFDAIHARDSEIPARKTVGIPAYPGAKVLFTQMNNRVNENGAWIDLPKRIFMGTPDTAQQVVGFYRQNLTGWKFAEVYGVPTFYTGTGKFNPEDMTTPRIVIAPEYRPRALMPTSKTTIDIYYSPE